MSQQIFARPYAAPPGVPTDRLAAMGKAVERAVNSPVVRSEFEKINSPLEPIGSEKPSSGGKGSIRNPTLIVEFARQALKGK